jgi:hypothetical protein
MTFNARYSGSFTSASPAARHDVVLPQGQPDYFRIRNRTAWGDDAAETSVEANWWRGMAFDAGQTIDQTVGTGAMSTEAITSNGFRFIDTANPPVFAELATTDITAANPAVVSMADTGSIAVGDVVRLSDTTAMLQISSYDFEVTAVTANVSITINFDGQNEAAAATAGNVRLFIPSRFYPRWRYIVPLSGAAGITQAASAVISTSVAHDFTVGERVSFRVPDAYGMTEIDGLNGTVTAVGTYTVTVNIDSSAFTAFALPTSAAFAAGLTPAIILPAGANPQVGANPPIVPTNAAFDNRNRYVMRIGTNVITSASAVYDWESFYSNEHTAE